MRGWLALALLLAPLSARAQDERDREIFGEAPPAEVTPAPAPADAAPVEVAPVAPVAPELTVRDDFLDLGGQLFARLEASIDEDTPAKAWGLTAPALLDVYLDARPNERVRAYVRGRVTHLATFAGLGERLAAGDPPPSLAALGQLDATTADLDQLWVKLDVARRLYVTAGRQQVRWGSGRFWNPTDFVNVRQRDPFAIFDERFGVDMLRLHYPVESLGWNFYAIALLDGAYRADRIGGAGRAELLVGTTEIALSAAARTGEPLQLGVDVTSGVWLLDLRAEAAVRRGVDTVFRRGPFDVNASEVELLEAYDRQYLRDDEWLVQVMVGGELSLNYSEQDSVIVGLEGFYNQAGYEDAELYPLLIFIDGSFRPLYAGRFYAGAYVLLPSPGEWNRSTFTLSGLGNLSDGSYLGRLDVAVTVLTYLRLNLFASAAFGANGELHYGLGVHRDAPLLTFVPEGLRPLVARGIEQPIVDAGAGLTMTF